MLVINLEVFPHTMPGEWTVNAVTFVGSTPFIGKVGVCCNKGQALDLASAYKKETERLGHHVDLVIG